MSDDKQSKPNAVERAGHRLIQSGNRDIEQRGRPVRSAVKTAAGVGLGVAGALGREAARDTRRAVQNTQRRIKNWADPSPESLRKHR